MVKKTGNKKKEEIEKIEIGSGERVWEFTCYNGLLKQIVNKLKPLSNEVKISIGKEGLSVKLVDPSHVAMVHIEVPRKNFYIGQTAVNKEIQYKLKDETDMGVDLDKLESKFLRLLNQFDHVHGYVADNCLYLDNGDGVHARIQLIDTCGMVDPRVPEFKDGFKVNVEVSVDKLEKLIRAMSKAGENDATGNYVILVTKDKILKGVIPYGEDEVSVDLKDKVDAEAKAMYSCDYFSNILKNVTTGCRTRLEFSTDNPLRVTGKFYDDGYYMYLIAPRIEESE